MCTVAELFPPDVRTAALPIVACRAIFPNCLRLVFNFDSDILMKFSFLPAVLTDTKASRAKTIKSHFSSDHNSSSIIETDKPLALPAVTLIAYSDFFSWLH